MEMRDFEAYIYSFYPRVNEKTTPSEIGEWIQNDLKRTQESVFSEEEKAFINENLREMIAEIYDSNIDVLDEDAFFVDKETGHVTWMYYNPDSVAGGQFVTNELTYEQILEASQQENFFDYLGSIAEQSLTDVGTEEFVGAKKEYLSAPDFTDCTDATKDKLISLAVGIEGKDKGEKNMEINENKKTLSDDEIRAANIRRAINKNLKAKYPDMSAEKRFALTNKIFESQQNQSFENTVKQVPENKVQESAEKKTLSDDEIKAANARRAINKNLKAKYPEMSTKDRYAKTDVIFKAHQKKGHKELEAKKQVVKDRETQKSDAPAVKKDVDHNRG